jgi:hypothetical protein
MKKFLVVSVLLVAGFCYAGSDMARSHKASAEAFFKEKSAAAADSAATALKKQ